MEDKRLSSDAISRLVVLIKSVIDRKKRASSGLSNQRQAR